MSTADKRLPVRANRAVSVRELMRTASALIDEVEVDGNIFALCRRGRMVALLTPLPERIMVEFRGPAPRETADLEPEPDVQPEWLELGPAADDLLLRALESYPMPFSLEGMAHTASEIGIGLGRLELDGLIELTRSGRRITPQGLATARVLARRLDSRETAPPS